MRVKYGESYDLDAIAQSPNAQEVLKDLSAFDNLENGRLPVQEQINDNVPTENLNGDN